MTLNLLVFGSLASCVISQGMQGALAECGLSVYRFYCFARIYLRPWILAHDDWWNL